MTPSQLVVIGQSLGTGIAAHLSVTLAKRGSPIAGTVLMSPYTSMAQVFDDHLPLIPIGWAVSEAYRTEDLAKAMTPPILMVHGEPDTVIGIRHSRSLAELLGSRAKLSIIRGAHHNDLWDQTPVLRTVQGFIHQLAARSQNQRRPQPLHRAAISPNELSLSRKRHQL